jgi:hypothetical protein
MKTGPDAPSTAENESESEKHETGPDALGTVENESRSAKHENGTRRPRYRRNALWSAKHEIRYTTPPVPPKMSLGAQDIITKPDAVSTAENEFGSEKLKNMT